MALIPTREVRHVLEGYEDQDLFTEGNLRTVMTEGWYTHPSIAQDMLIEREYTTINQFGNPMHRTKEEWSYDRPGGPPKKYRKEIWSKAFVPAVNPHRTLTKMEEETTVFWTFTPYAPDVLAYRRQVDAYVIYNLKPAADLTPEGEAKVEERGQKADGATDEQKRFHIASAQLWSEATSKGTVVEKADANQSARWVKGVIVEEVSVAEEIDRYTQWGWRKFALRPDDVECIGPNYFQKESFNYQLDVPVDPPRISVSNAAEDGVRIAIRGGGAKVSVPLTTGSRKYDRGPEMYRVFRKKIAEADREPSGDPYGLWDQEPAPAPRRSVIVNTFVGGYDGVPDPDGGLPPLSSYSEPHDPTPVAEDDWRSVGEAKNEAEDRDHDEGRAVLFDKDVTDGSTYLYAAVAVIQGSESPLSNQEQIEFDGVEPRTYSITVRRNPDGSVEADVTMPDDPATAGDYTTGEVVTFEIPAAVEELGIWSSPLDGVTLTVAATVDTEEETFSITPPNIPEVWTPEATVIITDVIGPGTPDASGVLRPYSVEGRIVSQAGTTLTVTGIAADAHLYPVGSTVEVYGGDDAALRLGDETGDGEEATIEALILAVGTRQGVKNRDESFSIDVDVKVPLLGLQAGADVTIVDVEWDAYGNDLWLQSQIEEVPWVLRGWEITVTRESDGKFTCNGTKLKLAQR